MTESEMQQLSREVAEKVGIYAYITKTEDIGIWLHDDIERCSTLAIEHSVDLNFYDALVNSSTFTDDGYKENNETYVEHNGNKIRATCVAILKALKEKA